MLMWLFVTSSAGVGMSIEWQWQMVKSFPEFAMPLIVSRTKQCTLDCLLGYMRLGVMYMVPGRDGWVCPQKCVNNEWWWVPQAQLTTPHHFWVPMYVTGVLTGAAWEFDWCTSGGDQWACPQRVIGWPAVPKCEQCMQCWVEMGGCVHMKKLMTNNDELPQARLTAPHHSPVPMDVVGAVDWGCVHLLALKRLECVSRCVVNVAGIVTCSSFLTHIHAPLPFFSSPFEILNSNVNSYIPSLYGSISHFPCRSSFCLTCLTWASSWTHSPTPMHSFHGWEPQSSLHTVAHCEWSSVKFSLTLERVLPGKQQLSVSSMNSLAAFDIGEHCRQDMASTLCTMVLAMVLHQRNLHPHALDKTIITFCIHDEGTQSQPR